MAASDQDGIRRAAEVIAAGGLAAFPTETVYGLGADATNGVAVAAVFAVKGRPAADPLIVHVADEQDAARLGDLGPAQGVVRALTSEFWPGPLTVVVPRVDPRDGSPGIAPEVSQLDSVGLRCPANEIALALIDAAGVPVAAPSANRFGRVSPTTAGHVLEELGDRVPIVLDGGPTRFGIESTVVASRGDRVEVLRPGAVTVESLRAILGKDRVEVAGHIAHDPTTDAAAANTESAGPESLGPEPLGPEALGAETLGAEVRGAESPGTSVSHYAPEVPVVLANSGATADELVPALSDHGVRVRRVVLPEPDRAAAGLYSLLRELDHEARRGTFDTVVFEAMDPSGLGRAVNDRLLRAANGHLVVTVNRPTLEAILVRLAR
ncbi:MAG: L-threonylcarbamoyladenylate synthase [Microthrixaceae bacterium]